MQLLTVPVWNRDGWMCRVNLEDVPDYVARGFTTVDPKGGTFTREKPIVVESARAERDARGKNPERKF